MYSECFIPISPANECVLHCSNCSMRLNQHDLGIWRVFLVVDFIFFKCSSSNSTHGMMIPPGGKNDHKVGIQPMTNENWEKLNWSLKSYGLATWQQWVCKAQEQESICMRTNRKKHVNVYGLCNLPNLGRSHAPWAPFRMTLCVEHLPLPEAQKPKG